MFFLYSLGDKVVKIVDSLQITQALSSQLTSYAQMGSILNSDEKKIKGYTNMCWLIVCTFKNIMM